MVNFEMQILMEMTRIHQEAKYNKRPFYTQNSTYGKRAIFIGLIVFILVYWQSSSYYSTLSNQQLNRVVITPTTIG